MSTIPAGAPAKVCVLCGGDCSKKPRVKDPQGRYSCKECVERVQKAAAAKAAAVTPAPAEDPVDEPLGHDLLAIEASADPLAGQQVCPNCQSSMPYGTTICVQCGYDAQKNAVISTRSEVEKVRSGGKGKCPECGYSLKGLKVPKCPECGTFVMRMSEREKAKYDSAKVTRNAYLKPIIHFAIGTLVVSMVLSMNGGGSDALMSYFLSYAITVPIGVLAFFLCCLVWIGFDAPMHLTAIRLAGVYALVDMSRLLLASFLPIPLLPTVITLAIYIGLLADSLDLDLQDAVIVGVLTGLIRFFALLAVVMYFLNQ